MRRPHFLPRLCGRYGSAAVSSFVDNPEGRTSACPTNPQPGRPVDERSGRGPTTTSSDGVTEAEMRAELDEARPAPWPEVPRPPRSWPTTRWGPLRARRHPPVPASPPGNLGRRASGGHRRHGGRGPTGPSGEAAFGPPTSGSCPARCGWAQIQNWRSCKVREPRAGPGRTRESAGPPS